MTVREAAKQLGVSSQTIYSLCNARQLRHSRVGLGRGKIAISEDAIAEYLHSREIGPVNGPPPVVRAKFRIALKHLNLS